uniref:VENN motif pre-toxin domain-containing protein n=1 Tax=Serratia marcescens TaxID=615 RepID=UPI0005760E4F
LNLTSGRDTRLIGAQASGEKVTVDVGRDLRLESEQDSDRYDARQQNASAGGSFTFGSMTGSANVSASKDKLHSNFDSVKEQTGLFAGKGGYDVKVKEHTQLDGAVIASTADKDKNRLDTGTLGWTDIHNQADYSATHSGGSFSTGGPVGKDLLTNMAGGMLSGANNSGHAEGATKAGVSEGTLIVRDKDKQQQDVAQLNRDTEHANAGSISPIFNKEKEQKRLKQAQLIGEIGGQAMDVIRTQGDIAGLKAALTAHPELKGNETALKQTDAYRKAMKEYGTGSDLQKAAQAVTGALTALAGNNLAGALASGASPYLATEIKKRVGEDNMAANAMAHAVLGAVTAQLNNQPALAGGLGAGGAELAARVIADKLFNADTPAKRAQLSESEKQQVSALSQLAAGLAGGLATGDTAGAVTAAQTGKNAVENNYLNQSQSIAFDKELSDCRKSGGDCQAVIDKWKQISDKQSAETDQKLKDNPLEAVVIDKELAQGGIEMTERPGWLGRIPGVDVMTSEEAKAYVQQWNSQDLANIDVNSPGWMSFASYASNPENQAALTSLGVLGKDLIAIAKNSLTTKSLFKEMTIQGIKFTPENVVGAAKDNSGKIIFLEKGNSKSGLQHIVEEHGDQFAQIGVSEARIPDVVMKAVTDGKIVGYQGAGAGRPIYETMIDGKKYNIAVTVGSNGYVVGANLRGSVK